MLDSMKQLHLHGVKDVVVCPIGFLSDHMEVLYDLDTEARALCDRVDLNMVRAATVGTHPTFVKMIRELIIERTTPGTPHRFLGERGPVTDVCPVDCCLMGAARPERRETAGA